MSIADFVTGWLLGLTGTVPFLHTNLIIALINATPAIALTLAITHLVFELFPMVFFGVPSASHGIAYLPAQQLSQKGEGQKAFFLAAAGLAAGVLFAIILSPLFVLAWPLLFAYVKPYTGILLVLLVIYAWVADGKPGNAALVFLGSGLLGITVFSLPLNEPLFPLLSGLFGAPGILLAGTWAFSKNEKRASWKTEHALAGAVLGGLSVLLPGLSPAFLASFAFLLYSRSTETFLVLSSAITSSKLFYDFLAATVIHKARSAPAAVLLDYNVTTGQLVPLLAAGVFAFAVSLGLALKARSVIARFFQKPIPPVLFLAFLSAGILFTSGLAGLFVLAWSSAWSMACLQLNTPRKYLLGALMLPAIIHSFGA
ncbi:tripartite tricarboxylate transporter permease [Candidatus Micrarchaeota archaeon]|nr:tripartite tricarboxylate transporter permease [Candidatus Micrarchaeota archaeon]